MTEVFCDETVKADALERGEPFVEATEAAEEREGDAEARRYFESWLSDLGRVASRTMPEDVAGSSSSSLSDSSVTCDSSLGQVNLT